ncbi:MAG: transaldolase family protein, partial [Acidaminococcaceae bacterium]
VKVFRNYHFTTEIIAASLRNQEQVKQMMLAGVQIATIPTEVLKKMLEHPLTGIGLAKFLADYQNSQQ